jgi:hypothetical protein
MQQPNHCFLRLRLHRSQVLVLMAGLLLDAETAVAVMGLSTQLSLLPWMFCYSLGTATATRVAQALGGGSALRASRILRCGVVAHGYSHHYHAVHSSLCRLLKYASRTAYYVAAAGNFSAVRYQQRQQQVSRITAVALTPGLPLKAFVRAAVSLQDGVHAGAGMLCVPVCRRVAAARTHDGSADAGYQDTAAAAAGAASGGGSNHM